MKIVKAEILFSRQCPLSCSYCGMKSKKQNTRSVEEWIKGMDQLKLLECEFVAFYGAEVLTEFEKLKHVIRYCEEELGMDTTIITSGIVPNFKQKLLDLHKYGARSLSMSYDPFPTDRGSVVKSRNSLQWLKWFKDLKNVRDVAAIATLNAKNFNHFPDMIKKMTKNGIWSFFDFVHEDRGQPGSKCKSVADNLKIEPEHYVEIKMMLEEVLYLKSRGYLCHTSENFVDVARTNMSNNDLYNWTCSNQEPSWCTVDCDGYVLPCDDFCGNANIDMTEIYDKWEEFCRKTTHSVKHHNCRCIWNSHIDAHCIKSGTGKIEEYVHGERNT